MGVWLIAIAAAAAQAPPDDAARSDSAIVVTGERVKRSLKDTPSSVAVFDGRDIDRMAAADRIGQILERVPNVLVVTNRDAPIIRGQAAVGVLQGLPAFLGGARPRTVMQIDGRTATFNEFVNSTTGLWDVDHVEVFRSPQTGWSTHMQVELVDEHGREMKSEGFTVSTMSEAGYGVNQLMRWDIDGGIGWGEDQDVWNPVHFVRVLDALKATA